MTRRTTGIRSWLRPPVKTRLVLGVAGMLLPLFFLSAASIYFLSDVIDSFDRVILEAMREEMPIAHLQVTVLDAGMPPHRWAVAQTPEEPRRFEEASLQVEESFAAVLSVVTGPSVERDLVDAAYQKWLEAREIGHAVFSLPSTQRAAQFERFDARIKASVALLDEARKVATQKMGVGWSEAKRAKQTQQVAIMLVFAVAFSLAGVASWLLIRSILNPLREMQKFANGVAGGDLSSRITVDYDDELGQLAKAFNRMGHEIEKNQNQLKYMSIHDHLTGVYNRREFHARLKDEMRHARRFSRPFSLLMVDVDYFKAINDSYGHLAGDEVLRNIAMLIRREARQVDRVARYGGEEFTVILPETDEEGAKILAERLRLAVERHNIPFQEGGGLHLTVSIGAATFPGDGGTEEAMINASDRALYAAKRAGRNRVCQAGEPIPADGA